jgi:GNAT superfamily N-acetyltransferase
VTAPARNAVQAVNLAAATPSVGDASDRPTAVTLPDGALIHVRRLWRTDEEALQALFYRLSEDSRYERFLSHKSRDCSENVTGYFESESGRNAAFVATSDDTNGELIAMASYAVDPRTGWADVSVVVRDEWQRRRVGTALFHRLVACARQRGIQRLTADVLATNGRMMALFHDNGLRIESELDAGVYRIAAAVL